MHLRVKDVTDYTGPETYVPTLALSLPTLALSLPTLTLPLPSPLALSPQSRIPNPSPDPVARCVRDMRHALQPYP